MIGDFAFAKSEQKIKKQKSFFTEGEGEPPGVYVAALMSCSVHNQGTVPQ